MPTLHIQLLGNFHITEDGTAVTGIDTARLQAFFCFLLLQAYKPQARHYIASVLWQESTESQARTNLRKYIHQLRHKLPAIDHLFHIGSHSIQWQPDAPAVVDVHEFERYLALAHPSQKLKPPDNDLLNALERAVAVYKGDLLPACYEEWIAVPRERLVSQYILTLDQLAQLWEQQGDYSRAIHYVQQLLERDTLRESSYRRLIHLYALAGNGAKAIEAYHQCAEVLRREMDVEPSSMTRTLYERVKTPSQPVVADVKRAVETETQQASHLEQMTVVWADIADFSTLSERCEPHLIFADLKVYMNLLRRLIQAGQGQVVKRMGDAMLATFAEADDALTAACAIQNELRLFNQQQYRNGRPPFHTRIGIATGDVLFVNLDIEGVREVEIMGNCVNIAVRLQEVTPVDGITVDQLTYTQCKSLINGKTSETLLVTKRGAEPVYILDRV